jgi:hypothetical protein
LVEQQFSKLKVTGSNPVGCNMLAMLLFATFYPAIGKILVYFLKDPISDVQWEKLNKLLKLRELGEGILRTCELLPILGVGVVVWIFALAYIIFLLQLPIITILMVISKLIWLGPSNNQILIYIYIFIVKNLVLLSFLWAIACGLV